MESINQLELFRIVTMVMDNKSYSEIKQVDEIVRRLLSARKVRRDSGPLCDITTDEMSVLNDFIEQISREKQ